MGDVHWLIIQESMLVQLMSWTGSNQTWVQVVPLHPHQDQQQQLKHQLTVDLHNGLLINGVMMKITMLIAIGMVELVVTMTLVDGTHIAQLVNVLSQLQPQPQQLQLKHQPLDVDLHNGPMINGVMMKTIMKNVILMVELVASMITVDGTPIAMIVSV